MKRHLPLILALAFGTATILAEDVTLGYCDGSDVQNGLSGCSAVAIKFPAEEFPMYAGSKIAGVRIGLKNDAVKGLRIFLKDTLDGNEFLSFRTGPLYAGWSDIYFDTTADYPYGDVCAGYEVPANVHAGVSRIPGLNGSNGYYTFDGKEWTDATETTGSPLCLQLIIREDSYSKNDVALLSANGHVVETGREFTLSGLLRNNTTRILSSVRLSCDWGDGPHESDATVEDILPGEIGMFHAPFDAVSETGTYNGIMKVVSVAGEADDYDFNNTLAVPFRAVADILPRKVLIEEFTGQACPNCPVGKSSIQEGVKDLDDCILVCHHIGFGEDAFTAPGSSGLLYFYATPGKSYAPAIMIDRMPGDPGPVQTVPEPADIRASVTERLESGAEVEINIDQEYTADGDLAVHVGLRKVDGMETGRHPVLTLMLVEDGITGFQAPNYDHYTHDDVVRRFLSASLGDNVTLSGSETTTYDYTVTLNSDYHPENMRVVAVVSNYDSANPNNCRVYNAEQAALPENSGIIGAVFDTDSTITEILDPSGRRMNNLQPGVNIVRRANGTVEKIIVNK